MSKFEEALDDAYDALERKLSRLPTSDESERLEDELFRDWLKAGRFDALIEFVHDAYELEGGDGQCVSIGEALRRHGDIASAERLFDGLIVARMQAFWRSWPQAESGHIGQMREAAKHMASTMAACAGLYHLYSASGLEAKQAAIREWMLGLQQRAPAAKSWR